MQVTRRLILQKARHQATACAATPFDCLWARGFRCYFTPLPGCFSPFPHGTSSLSVTREYLALEGGPPRFRPRFTAAVLLRNFDRQVSALSPTGRLPSMVRGSTRLRLEPDLVTAAGSRTTRTRSPTTPGRQRVRAYTCQV